MNDVAIIKAVSKHIKLTGEEQASFLSLLESTTVKPKEFILRAGTVCRYSWFVNSGCLRSFTVDSDGVEHILSFAPAGWWIADLFSLFSQKPGMLNIEAMSESELLLLSKPKQEELYKQVPKFERFFRIITENALVASQQRLMDNLSLSAKERYLKFCDVYPGLIDSLPQKQVASYIGVTPEFLSKMKKELGRQK